MYYTGHSEVIRMTGEPQNELLYSAIEADLRQKILSGQYKAGEKLPTEAELCEAFGVSRITVRRAIQNLVDDDLLRRYRGKGTFVRPKQHPFDKSLQNNLGFSGLASMGGKAKRHIVESYRMPASVSVAKRLNIPQGNEVQYVKRLGIVDDEPMVLDNIYVSSEFLPTFLDDLKEGYSLYRLLETDYHLELDYADLSFSASIASQDEAELLECFVGAPVLVFNKVTYTTDGKVAHYSKTLIAGDRSSERILISRDGQIVGDDTRLWPDGEATGE